MPSLLEKIESNADKRLVLPAGRTPSQELQRYRNFLKVENHRLRIQHRGGARGRDVCKARAAVYDTLIKHILAGVRESQPELGRMESAPWALVATGGYGRAELNPLSDIDIMFLFHGEIVSRGRPHPYLSALNEGLLLTLWDVGLRIGHAVRSVFDCVQLANRDMQSKTSLIEARLITGNSELFKVFQQQLQEKCVTGHDAEYTRARLADQQERRSKYGNSACMQEPNIKSGCGGLRDYQNLLWMALFKYGTRSLTELVRREFMSAAERKQLRAAYDFLLRVRNELHLHFPKASPAMDVLSKNLQPAVATNLGFTDRSPARRIERFMCELYTHTRHIYLITRTLEERMALVEMPDNFSRLKKVLGFRRKPPQTHDGFRIENGLLRQGAERVFRDQPRRLMRVFLHAQKRRLKLHPDLRQLIRNSLSLVNRAFLEDLHVRDTFLEILNQRGSVAPILREMHEVDFLGKYLPEFGRLTCLVQHEFYHVYAADEHVLMCLHQLDQVWEAKGPPHHNYTEIFQDLDRPYVLYLALLLHDAGKGITKRKRRHEDVGEDLARRVAARLRLDEQITRKLCLLIKHHLLMASISQRRDLEDPTVIRHFADEVESPANLNMLTLHTFADTMGTSPKMWNGFKDALLRLLHEKTLPLLTGGTQFVKRQAQQREAMRRKIRRKLPKKITEDEIEAHFANLPQRYFRSHSVEEVAQDIQLTHRFMRLQLMEEDRALEPVIAWHNDADRGYTAVKICTWDRAQLFSKIAGSFSANGLSILGARIFSRTDGIVIDTFFVNNAETGALVKSEEREGFKSILGKVLSGRVSTLASRVARRKRHAGTNWSPSIDSVPARVYFDNTSSAEYTVIDIEAEDHHGLLYDVSRLLGDMGISIALAKVVTEKGAAVDSFYVYQGEGGKILDPGFQREIGDALLRVLQLSDADGTEPV